MISDKESVFNKKIKLHACIEFDIYDIYNLKTTCLCEKFILF